VPSLRGASALAISPQGKLPYVVAEGGNSLVELPLDASAGSLALASADPAELAPLSGPAALALSPGGANIYVASPFDDGVAAFVQPSS
jgi:DNA-binding beta-propeller fold protein YncE